MQYFDPEQGWDWFVRKTRRTALMYPSAALATRADKVLLRPPHFQTVGGGVLLGMLGVVLLYAGYAQATDALGAGAWLCLGFGALAVVGALACLGNRAKVVWAPYGRTVTLCRGVGPFARTVELPKNRLRAELSVANDESSLSNLKPGHTLLSLAFAGKEGKVRLVCSAEHENARKASEQLSAFLGAAAEDLTSVPLRLGDGTTVQVDTWPLAKRGNAAMLRLQFPSPGKAVYRSRTAWPPLSFVLSGVLIGAGMAIVGGGDLAVLGVFLLGASIALLLPLALARGLLRRSVVADRRAGMISVRGGRGTGLGDVRVADVAGVQIGTFYDTGGEGSTTYCEVNLVLRRPPGARVNLLTEADEDAVRREAQQFADFLGVPLWDHSSGAAARTWRAGGGGL